MSPKKTAALLASTHHKNKYCKADYDARLKENTQQAVETLLKKLRKDKTIAYSHGVLGGMYEIRLDQSSPDNELKFSLTCHLDPQNEYNIKPKFFTPGPFKKKLQVGFHESYLTVNKRRQIRDFVIEIVDRMKEELLHGFNCPRIILSFGKSFKACGKKLIPNWVCARPHSSQRYLCSHIYGSVRVSVAVHYRDEENPALNKTGYLNLLVDFRIHRRYD